MESTVAESDSSKSMWGRLSEGVCRRAFSSPEAFLYEATIAVALSRVVLPALEPHVRGRRVLDVGSGGGRLATAICGDCSLVGVDPSWPQVRRFSRRVQGRAVTIQAEGEALPFSADAFDTVYSSCVYKHWQHTAVAMRECARVVRPGGTLITVEIDGAASPAQFRRFADQSRVPVGLRAGYVRFAMRTVVGVAPSEDGLRCGFDNIDVSDLRIDRIADMPFLVATATAS